MIEVNNVTKISVNKSLLRKVAKKVLEEEGGLEQKLSIVLVGQKRAAELNRKYRNKNKIPNVLAFPAEIKGNLGELVLCPQQIKKEASQYGMIFEKALAWMLIHGLLHLLGYNHNVKQHTKAMEQKEHMYLFRL